MRMLLTNDDGITSDGLWAVARGLARVGQLTVIGTVDDWSGGGASIRLSLEAHLAPFEDMPAGLGSNVTAYSIDAAPGGAILVGLMSGLFEPFDLVVSGANYGVNIGADLPHSGTLGAAVTAYLRGVTAFAISTGRGAPRGEPQHWDGVSDVSERIARWLGSWDGPPLLLNVNVPNRQFSDMRGAAIVRPVPWGHVDRAGFTAHPAEGGGWLLTARAARRYTVTDDSDTDAGAVEAGKIAITPVAPTGCQPPRAPDELQELVRSLVPEAPATSII